MAIPDHQRIVLVSGVGSFNDETAPEKNQDLQFYLAVIRAKPYTALHDREWSVLVSDKCPDSFYALIALEAAKIAGVKLSRQLPLREHRRKIADCAVLITITGYSAILSGIAAGVPTVSAPTKVFAYGDSEGLNDRHIRALHYDRMRKNHHDSGAARPAWLLPVEAFGDPAQVAEIINHAFLYHVPGVWGEFNFNGAQNAAQFILDDYSFE
jgi:hypothetical protein